MTFMQKYLQFLKRKHEEVVSCHVVGMIYTQKQMFFPFTVCSASKAYFQ